jgi:RNA polymerase sigma-70 factor (ECF subfamily)
LEEADFGELIRRVRAGDQQAATELVRRYEPAIRLAVRVRLTDVRMRRVMDSMDICQSVLGNFFVRAAAGQFELEKPEQLLALLTTMARNKLTNQAERHRAARRDVRRQTTGDAGEFEPAARTPSPSVQVSEAELLAELRRRLTPEEQELAELRSQGLTWEAIAARRGDTPDALRVKYSRAVDRIVADMRLDE